jgi:hypothetical protein
MATRLITPNFMVELKRSIYEVSILLLQTSEVDVNFISFSEVELLKLKVF